MTMSISTDDVQDKDRFDFWHDVICSAFVRLGAESLPSEEVFSAEIASVDLGPLMLSRVSAQPHSVRRSDALISDQPCDQVLVSLQLSGTGVIRQDEREAVLSPGDFALYDTSRPYELMMPGRFEMLVLQFDRQFLLERCPSPELLTAIRIPNNNKVTAPVSSFLRALEPIALDDGSVVSRQLATSALDLMGLALAGQFGVDNTRGTGQTKHFLRACTYINANSDDADLSPQQVAEAIGVSVRYLHQLFRLHDTTVTKYLIKRRLAKCMDELVSPQFAFRSITDIAHNHGFKTSAHFTRCFTNAYGSTPSQVRKVNRQPD